MMPKVLTLEEKVDRLTLLVESLIRQSNEQYEDVIEKVANLNLYEQDYSIERTNDD